LSRHFAMLVFSSPAKPALPSGEPAAWDPDRGDRYPQLHPVAGCDGTEDQAEDRLRADLASRVLSGPGLWTGWLEELDRRGLIEELLAKGVIDEAVATAPHGHQLDRTLNAKTTLICVLAGCLFPGEGYDGTLRIAFGLPGLGAKPGTTVPAGPALSKARVLLGEQVMRRIFELDAARADVELGIGSTWHGMETTAFDGTTAELCSNDELAGAFGVPTGGTKPKLRIVAHIRTGSRRWIGAAVGGYHDGENALVDDLARTLRDGMLNLADRGFFSMDRWIRFSATGAHLCWRVKNGAKSVPFKTLKTLPDGSELVVLHESDGMLGKRRRDIADPAASRLPDTIARLVQFTIVTRTARGRTKTSVIRVLTTLLDHAAFPAAQIAALYAERWQVETAYLHLKKTLRGARRVLRGQSVILARQEAWAFLLVHNMIATLAARAAALAGIDPDAISFTAVLGLVRAHLQADTCCPHCGRRPAGDPLARLLADVIAHPRNRTGRKRTSGRTPTERRTGHTEEATYTITTTPSNLPKWDQSHGS
jgi:Transposase DDE domain/Insertion element 4 transposase N-terminal